MLMNMGSDVVEKTSQKLFSRKFVIAQQKKKMK